MDEIRDIIKIGLDFGTHQTKICIQRTPDEGHGIPEYEFMTFVDKDGIEQYSLPSVIQINQDDRLSYGFVVPIQEKQNSVPLPIMKIVPEVDKIDKELETKQLLDKYAVGETSQEDVNAIHYLLDRKLEILETKHEKLASAEKARYESALEDYKRNRNLFRYFKQATFAGYEWNRPIASDTLCIWYLTYIIFILEKRFGTGFDINMGVPTDERQYEMLKIHAVRILRSAFYLAEDVFEGSVEKFLSAKYQDLLDQTILLPYNEADKEEFGLNIFPEAYASLVGMTSRGKISDGMSLNVDIGGGTTDISFFTVNDKKPMIYRYWSIPYGLNYIAESSGFDYADGDFSSLAESEAVETYNRMKLEVGQKIERELLEMLKTSSVSKGQFLAALHDRVVIYNGGGSNYEFLSVPVSHFSDVKSHDVKFWEEENIKDIKDIKRVVMLLATSYGLAVSNSDAEVELCDFESLFPKDDDGESKYERREIDKDVC
jgi:hypothetical protein